MRAIAILNVGCMDAHAEQEAECVDENMALAASCPHQSPAGRVQSPFLRCLASLGVDDCNRGTWLASGCITCRDIKRVVDAIQRTVPVPQHEIAMRRALGWQIFRHRLPLAAGRQHVENRVQNLADIDRTAASAASRGRDHRRNKGPLRITQITGIAQAAPVGRQTVFRLPHFVLLSRIIPEQGITTDSFDSSSSWIGSKALIETGVDQGMGAVVLCSALSRNALEGHPGKYYGTDINPDAGYYLQPPYSNHGQILYGDSLKSLEGLSCAVDLFINDSHHSEIYEEAEYEL